MKKTIAILIILAMSITSVVAADAVTNQREITVTIDGQAVSFPDQKPYIENNRTLVPVRFVTEALGAEVEWVQTEQKVKIKKDNELIELVIDQSEVKVGSKTVQLDVPAKIQNGRTMVPLRFVSEVLGAGVEWDQATYTASITINKDDLLSVPLISEAKVDIKVPESTMDFTIKFILDKPMEPQYIDAENLLKARFGENNSAIESVLDYLRVKAENPFGKPNLVWEIKDRTVAVTFGADSSTFVLFVMKERK
jgi:hypothetical protein